MFPWNVTIAFKYCLLSRHSFAAVRIPTCDNPAVGNRSPDTVRERLPLGRDPTRCAGLSHDWIRHRFCSQQRVLLANLVLHVPHYFPIAPDRSSVVKRQLRSLTPVGQLSVYEIACYQQSRKIGGPNIKAKANNVR